MHGCDCECKVPLCAGVYAINGYLQHVVFAFGILRFTVKFRRVENFNAGNAFDHVSAAVVLAHGSIVIFPVLCGKSRLHIVARGCIRIRENIAYA